MVGKIRAVGRARWPWAVVAVALAAAPTASAQAVFPSAMDGEPLTGWMRRETDITAAQVVAISPSAVTAVVSTFPIQDPPGMRIVVRAEAASAAAAAREGVLSWHVSVAADCRTRRVRLGETTGYPGRNLLGEGRMIRPMETDWRVPQPGTPLDSIWRLGCDREFRRPLSPQTGSIAMPPPAAAPVPAVPRAAVARIAQAAPAPRAPVPAAAHGGAAAVVQISATGSEAAASQDLARLTSRFGDLVGGHGLRVETVTADGRTLFRALVTGFGARAEADRLCEALKRRGQGCFVRAGS